LFFAAEYDGPGSVHTINNITPNTSTRLCVGFITTNDHDRKVRITNYPPFINRELGVMNVRTSHLNGDTAYDCTSIL
jgi:hypothetical protein